MFIEFIKQNILLNQGFYFSNTGVRHALKEATALNNKNNGTFGNTNIPTKLLNEVHNICASIK